MRCTDPLAPTSPATASATTTAEPRGTQRRGVAERKTGRQFVQVPVVGQMRVDRRIRLDDQLRQVRIEERHQLHHR